jgi:hypothetical protein
MSKPDFDPYMIYLPDPCEKNVGMTITVSAPMEFYTRGIMGITGQTERHHYTPGSRVTLMSMVTRSTPEPMYWWGVVKEV